MNMILHISHCIPTLGFFNHNFYSQVLTFFCEDPAGVYWFIIIFPVKIAINGGGGLYLIFSYIYIYVSKEHMQHMTHIYI